MFFRRRKPRPPTLEEQLNSARQQGFTVASAGPGRAKLSKHGCSAVVEAAGPGQIRFLEAGLVIEGTIARLEDRGYQKFFLFGNQARPALAEQLRDLHRFIEEVRHVFGVTTLYNESLGTVSNGYHYDRLEGRGVR
jgi:hypothetical protein